MPVSLRMLHEDESGQAFIEFGLIAFMIALAGLAGLNKLSKPVNVGCRDLRRRSSDVSDGDTPQVRILMERRR